MTAFIGANGREEPGDNWAACAGGCGDTREFPRSFGKRSPYWCGPCLTREADKALAQLQAARDTEPAEPGPVRERRTTIAVRDVSGLLSGRLNRVFYAVVLAGALTGASTAAARWLDWPLWAALAVVGAVELGGVALSVHADTRRRIGERAYAARALSATVAAGAVAVNWFGHIEHLGRAAFFAGLSALGYAVWLIDSAARRRDQLRAVGKLEDTPPAYGLVQWVRHPWLTRHARTLALADPGLGKLGSLRAARAAVRVERRTAAIATLLHRRIAEAVDPLTAQIAVHTFDLDKVAARLAAGADYDTLTRLVAADLAPARLAAAPLDPPPDRTPDRATTRAQRPDTTGARIARLRERRPDITQADVARRLGIDVRTARRHWKDTQPDTDPGTGHATDNGGPVPAEAASTATRHRTEGTDHAP